MGTYYYIQITDNYSKAQSKLYESLHLRFVVPALQPRSDFMICVIILQTLFLKSWGRTEKWEVRIKVPRMDPALTDLFESKMTGVILFTS